MREKQFNIRFSEEESERLEELAEHYGLNGAGVIRMLVKGRYDELFVARNGKSRRRRLPLGDARQGPLRGMKEVLWCESKRCQQPNARSLAQS